MTLRAPNQIANLTKEEVAVIRGALTACSQMLYWAERHGGLQFRQALDQATQAASGRSRGHWRYEVCLAIDYLDFAPAPRSWR